MKNTYAPCAVPQSTLVNAINLNIYFLHLHEKRNIHNVLVSLLAAQYYPGGRRERERRREKYKIERERRRGKEKEREKNGGREGETLPEGGSDKKHNWSILIGNFYVSCLCLSTINNPENEEIK